MFCFDSALGMPRLATRALGLQGQAGAVRHLAAVLPHWARLDWRCAPWGCRGRQAQFGRGGGFPGVPAGFPGQRPQMGMGVGRSPYGLGCPQRAGFGPPGLLNPQVISIFTNLFLQARPAALFFFIFVFFSCTAQLVQHACGCLRAPAPLFPCLQRPPARNVRGACMRCGRVRSCAQHSRSSVGCGRLPVPTPLLPCLQRPPARGVCDARTHHDDSLLVWRHRQGQAPAATDAAQRQRGCHRAHAEGGDEQTLRAAVSQSARARCPSRGERRPRLT